MDFKWVADHFDKLQFLLLFVVVIVAYRGIQARQEKTSFRSRESDRADLDRLLRSGESIADAKMKKARDPILLPGIRLSGEPYEILGISADASTEEILRSYKEKIKLFHPDRIQGQARDQIQFYENAAAVINRAKEEMLARRKK